MDTFRTSSALKGQTMLYTVERRLAIQGFQMLRTMLGPELEMFCSVEHKLLLSHFGHESIP